MPSEYKKKRLTLTCDGCKTTATFRPGFIPTGSSGAREAWEEARARGWRASRGRGWQQFCGSSCASQVNHAKVRSYGYKD